MSKTHEIRQGSGNKTTDPLFKLSPEDARAKVIENTFKWAATNTIAGHEIWNRATAYTLSHARSETPAETWNVIRTAEDLPNITHSTDEFWWTNRINGQVSRNGFNPDSRQRWLEAYSAWMPVTKPKPYAPSTDGKED